MSFNLINPIVEPNPTISVIENRFIQICPKCRCILVFPRIELDYIVMDMLAIPFFNYISNLMPKICLTSPPLPKYTKHT